MEAQAKKIKRYITNDGKVPFAEWFDVLRDSRAKVRIEARLERVKLGNFGDYRSVGQGVCELRIKYGSGYRVYFGFQGSTISKPKSFSLKSDR